MHKYILLKILNNIHYEKSYMHKYILLEILNNIHYEKSYIHKHGIKCVFTKIICTIEY